MPSNSDLEHQDGSQNDPAAAPAENGEGNEEIDLDALPEPVQKRLKNAEGIISNLKEKAGVKSVKELEAKFDAFKSGKQTPKPERQEADDSRVVTHEELAAYQQGYSPEELSVARSLKPNVKIGDALNDPTVKAAINGIRSEKKTQGQIPEPSSRIPIVNGKAFSELPANEKKANYAKTVETMLQKGRGRGGRNVGQ